VSAHLCPYKWAVLCMAVQFRLDWLAPLDAGLFLCPSDAVILMPTTFIHPPDPPLHPPEPVSNCRQERSTTLESYLLPTRWACYFVNHDPSALNTFEIAAADGWWQDTFYGQNANCVEAGQDYGFSAFHDAAGFWRPADCTFYRFLLHPTKTPAEVFA